MSNPFVEHAFRFCPRCATGSAHVGNIPFRCNVCGLTLYFGPVGAVGALVVNENNEVLLVRRARDPGKGMFGLPGGFIDRDETAEDALIREVREETQLEIRDIRLTLTYPNHYQYGGITVPVLDLFFECQVVDPSVIELVDGELAGYCWTNPTDDQLSQMAFESNRRAIQHWIARKSGQSHNVKSF